MEPTYTLKEVAGILCAGGDEQDFERAARQVRHWTNCGLLNTASEKYVGTGRSRLYVANEIRLAAWYSELARYGIQVSLLEAVRERFDFYDHEGYWESIGRATTPAFYEMAWDRDMIVSKISDGEPELITRKPHRRRKKDRPPSDGSVLDPENIASVVTLNLTKIFSRLPL